MQKGEEDAGLCANFGDREDGNDRVVMVMGKARGHYSELVCGISSRWGRDTLPSAFSTAVLLADSMRTRCDNVTRVTLSLPVLCLGCLLLNLWLSSAILAMYLI